jgi:hypothetical protein
VRSQSKAPLLIRFPVIDYSGGRQLLHHSVNIISGFDDEADGSQTGDQFGARTQR